MRAFSADRYKSMPYRYCGKSGLKLPLISLGLWQSLGREGNDETCRDVMFAAFDSGITHFDLANNYGPPPGNSESVAGKILKEMPRDELIVSTKAGFDMWDGPYGKGGSKKYLVASLDQSLKRLGLEYVDIFYHHCPDHETPLEETLGALDLIVRQGKALYAGVSNYGHERYAQAVDVINRHDWTPITIHQPYYNMLSRAIEPHLAPLCETLGTGIIAFCPLAGGLLTDKYLGGLSDKSRMGQSGDWGKNWYEDQKKNGNLDKVARLNAIAKDRGQSLPRMALAWTVRKPAVTSALIGVSSLAQLEENLKTLDKLEFTPEEIAQIDSVIGPA
jgi:L-glyceraldehyde 3-phosphate reductase